MSGSHSAQRTASNSKWKIVVLVVALVLVLAAVGFLVWQLLGGGLGGGTAQVAPGIFTQVDAAYGSGKNVSGNLSITQGTQAPDSIPETDQVVLLDIAWTGRKQLSEPVYITVSDPSFIDGDGLSVHHYDSTTGQWEVLGTYTIANNSVTFLTNSLSPFAFQIISANAAEVTPEPIVVTPAPTNTPEPTPEPTPAPIQVNDYGQHTAVQTSAFTLAKEMEDDAVYVMALVKDLPADALATTELDAEEEDDAEEEEADEEEGLSISYVEAPEATTEPAGDAAAAAEPAVTPIATVLVNKDGTNFTTVDMPLVQAENGAWCLGGPVTDGMTWTANRDAYKDEHRFSLSNNGGYLNLADDNQTMAMNDNSTWTRWLIDTVTKADGTDAAVLNYRNDDRYYVNQLGLVAETLPGVTLPAATTAEPLPDGTVPAEAAVTPAPETIPGAPVYLGMSIPQDNAVTIGNMQFTMTTDQNAALQVVLFKLDSETTLPAGVVTTLEHNVIIPEINETTNLSSLVFQDGDKILQLGKDYVINARVVNNDHVVVVIQFIGDYAGQIVRTYPGTTIITDNMPAPTETPAPTPEPTAAPNYSGGGEGSNVPPANTQQEAPPASTWSTPSDSVLVEMDPSDDSTT